MKMSDQTEKIGFVIPPASGERTKNNPLNFMKRRNDGYSEAYGMTNDKTLLSSWEIQFEAFNMSAALNVRLECDDALVLGVDVLESSMVNLKDYFQNVLGVSHHHLRIFSIENELFLTDLESTSGTRLNGRSVIPGKSYCVYNGDFIELGNLVMAVNILRSPKDSADIVRGHYIPLHIIEHLSSLTASGLDLDKILERFLEISLKITQADQASLWMAGGDSNSLVLKVEYGMEGNRSGTTRISLQENDPITDALHIGKSFRVTGKIGRPVRWLGDGMAAAVLYTPLILREELIGVLIAAKNNNGSSFSSKDEYALRILGKYCVTVFREYNSQQLAARVMQKKLEEFSTYQNILQSLFKQNNLVGIYGELRELIRHRWSVENVGMWLLNDFTNQLDPFPQPSFHKTYALGENLIGSVAVQPEPVLKNNVQIFAASKDENVPTLQLLARSAVCAPLIVGEKTVGVLAMFSLKDYQFTDEDAKLFGVYSQAAAEVVQKTLLFDQVRKQKATILAAVNMLQHPLLIINHDGKLIMSNKAANIMVDELQSGLSKGEDISNRATTPSLASFLNELSNSKSSSREIVVGNKVYVATLESAAMIGTVIFLQDVTDPITGVFGNHHYHVLADQTFAQAKRYRKPLAALIIGLDGFHEVLKEQGYAVGNQILRELANRLRSYLRTSDVLGRYQEEKFMVFLPETDLANAKITAERIFDQLKENPIGVEKKNRLMSKLVMGGALLKFDTDTSINDLINRVNQAFLSAMVDNKSKIKFSE